MRSWSDVCYEVDVVKGREGEVEGYLACEVCCSGCYSIVAAGGT